MFARVNSIKRPKLPQFRKTIQSTFGNDGGHYEMNEYIHKNFFHEENYQSILKCLDDGYHIMSDQIEYMEGYCTLLKNFIESLTSYSNEWKSKLKHQATLSSYNTTKQCQIEFFNSSVQVAQLIKTRSDAIEQIISSFRKQINRLYPRERFAIVRKHYRTESMKKKFKDACEPRFKASKLIDEIEDEKKKIEKSLHQARIDLQNLELNETTSKSKIDKANERVEQKQKEFHIIDEKLVRAKEDLIHEEEVYHEEAMKIYEKCREYEAERLNLIRETLIEFIHAIHPTNYSTNEDTMYIKLLAIIESQQNTQADLDFWAQIYHVTDHIPRSISTESIHPKSKDSITTIEENTSQSIVESEEDQIIPTTTTVKTKAKKKKNTTNESNNE